LSTRQHLLEEINDVLALVMEFLHGGSINKTYPEPLFIYLSTVQLRGSEKKDFICTLPDEIQSLKDGIQSKQQEIDQQSQRIVNQILEISQVNQERISYNPV
jgi:hypothetical protein